MIRYREYDDGTRVFPPRGNPPAEMPGYIRDEGNPFVFYPILPECELRVQQYVLTQCCGKQHAYWACKADGLAGYRKCSQCTESGTREELIQIHGSHTTKAG
jgi:hypothetical protein